MSRNIPTGQPNGATTANFTTSPGSSEKCEVIVGTVAFKESVQVLDSFGGMPNMLHYTDSSRCRIIQRGDWIYVSWPVEDDTNEYNPSGTRRLWSRTPLSNVKYVLDEGECPDWLR